VQTPGEIVTGQFVKTIYGVIGKGQSHNDFSLSAISKNYFGLHDPGHALGRTRVFDGKKQPGARLLPINAPISRKQAPVSITNI